MRRVTVVTSSWLAFILLSAVLVGGLHQGWQSLKNLSTLVTGSPVYAQAGGVDTGEDVQTNPKIRVRNVTATVPDNLPPTTPILISPPNNSLLTDNTPSFVWEGSTDDQGINKYVFYLDGSVYFDDLPTGDTITPAYTLTYDSGTNRYTLTPTNTISDGTHTWKIQVWDNSSHSTDSVTWTFTIDSTAPSFVISQIGTAQVTISAQDVSTVPVTPLVLTANEPLIVATGEPLSTVQTTLIIPGDATQNFTSQINANGDWNLQLGILPRGVVMTLNFLITDAAGNISVLNGVQFMIEEEVIVFPPVTPSPTPSPLPSGEPGFSPSPQPPITPGPSPLIVVTVTPPREVIYNTVKNVLESLPIDVQRVIQALSPVLEQVAPVSAVVVAVMLPIISTIAVASQFGGSLSLSLLFKILQALGLIPIGRPQGLVFNSDTDEGVPFAVLTFKSQNQGSELSIIETVVTDSYGIYKGITLPAGDYQIEVNQQDFRFPTRKNRPVHLAMPDYYRGEIFSLKEKQQPLFLIPMDPLVAEVESRWQIKFRLFLARLSRQSSVALFPLALLSAILVISYPTIWNWLVFALYAVLVIRRLIFWFRVPLITGQVIDEHGQPMSKVIVRLATVRDNSLAAVLLTDKKGEFAYYGRPALYQLSLQKPEYVWMDQGAALSFFEVDARAKREHVVANLTPLSQVYASMTV